MERLAIIAIGTNTEQQLRVPDLPPATGTEMTSTVYETLESWDLTDYIQAFGFDITTSNTGKIIIVNGIYINIINLFYVRKIRYK